MQNTVSDLVKFIKFNKIIGDDKVVIKGVNSIDQAKEGDLTFIENPKYFSCLEITKASAVLILEEVIKTKSVNDLGLFNKTIIVTKHPSFYFSKIAAIFLKRKETNIEGINKDAIISQDVVIGKNVNIGSYTVVESGVNISDNVCIYPGVYIGPDVKIGNDSIIYPNVTIRDGSIIGQRVVIRSGVVIGDDGFGFAEVDGVHQKIPQLGIVVIEDDVDIGCNTTIDRARFDKTIIGQGTKIDNLVQIAHNVKSGKNCLIIAQAGIAGSVTLGDSVILAGQSGVSGHLKLGNNVIVGGQAGVIKSFPDNSKVFGFPARPFRESTRISKAVQKMPDYINKIKDLENRIQELEGKINNETENN